MAASPDEEEDDDDLFGLLWMSVLHVLPIIVISFLIKRYLCKRCRRGNAEVPDGIVAPRHLQRRKQLLSSYLLYCVGGMVGLHHYYLDRVFHGLLATGTLNLFGVGLVLDLFFMPWYVQRFNRQRTHPEHEARDNSRWQLLCQLPILILSVFVFLVVFVLYTPRTLSRLGVIVADQEQQANAYDVLGLSGDVDFAEVKSAYRRLSKQWHPDKNLGCGKECEDKMAEITQAFDLIRKNKSPPAPDRSFWGRTQSLGREWLTVVEYLVSQEDGNAAGASSSASGRGSGTSSSQERAHAQGRHGRSSSRSDL